MNILKMTDSEVYHLGIDTLLNKLGTIGTTRFLNQIQPRTGNYTLERYEWLDNLPDIDTLVEQIHQASKEAKAEQHRISKLKADISENGKPQATRIRETTNEDLYRLGLEFLVDKLGPGGMSHFLRVCEPGRGVYAVDRYKNPKLIEQACEEKQKQAS